jgi:hypothetical protein
MKEEVNNEIIKIANKLNVLVVDENTNFIYVNKPTKIYHESCIWNHIYLTRAKITKIFDSFTGLHTYGYQGLFKPSIAEVIDSMTEDIKQLILSGDINAVIIKYSGFTEDCKMHKSRCIPVLAEFDDEITEQFTEW